MTTIRASTSRARLRLAIVVYAVGGIVLPLFGWVAGAALIAVSPVLDARARRRAVLVPATLGVLGFALTTCALVAAGNGPLAQVTTWNALAVSAAIVALAAVIIGVRLWPRERHDRTAR